ncbi:thiosulfate oxidation carrier protein SoxY [Thiohalobacter sp. IOR34]|uniref:thiosulfate oxidation carrier protein SoxY n=1 Tax=Thiohalobacter sp. IOR34 TaxID=3057176 RepID=UPI00339D7A05
MKRRTLLKGTLAAGAVSIAAGSGLLTPRTVMAAWPKDAFTATSVDAALNALFGSSALEGSDKIKIKAPDIAENGAVVPVSVSTSIDGIESISIVAEKNANPLTSSYTLGPGTAGYIATRIKMGKTSSVIAVVKAGGKLYSTGKEVKVTIGGCGG